ncbi:MAG: flagellar filament capping protein FliD, partial [candidate division Zixibacteria bacterium]
DQLDYNSETNKSGVLLGESSLITLLSDIRTSIVKRITGIDGNLDTLSDIGITFGLNGKLKLDSSILNEKIAENLGDVKKLLLASGSSDNGYISFMSAGPEVVPSSSGYDVDITQAALQGKFDSAVISDPENTNLILTAENNNIQLKVNGMLSSAITLEAKTYTSGDDLAQEIEEKINADSSLGSNEVSVAWVDNGDTGYLQITSTLWGENSKVEIDSVPSANAHNILGFTNGTSTEGQDVEGTINGESATGIGQILTGDNDNSTTEGLKLKIELSGSDLVEGSEGKIFVSKGVAALLSEKIDNYTDANVGLLNSKTDSIQTQINNIKDQVERMEQQLERKRAVLYRQFMAMEEALGQLQVQQQYLTSAIASLPQIGSRNSGGGLQ